MRKILAFLNYSMYFCKKELLDMTEKEINKIVSENLNYVKSVANQYKGKGVEFDDLVSEGTLAMLMAARKFQADRGTD